MKKLPVSKKSNNFTHPKPTKKGIARAKKYIDIKMTGNVFNVTIPPVNPDDIIFFGHFFDMGFDHESEDMGHFFEIAYLDGDEIKAEWGNPGDWEKIEEFIKKMGDKFVRADNQVLFNFFNKSMLPDLKIEKDILIYKNKYRLGGLSIVPDLAFFRQTAYN